jgi:hypothetical protein
VLLATLFCAQSNAENEPSWLAWSAPPECPTAADIELRAAELYGAALPAHRHLAVTTKLDWTGTQWAVFVDVELDGQRGDRQVAVNSCAEASDFVAVAVVLAIDPTSSRRLVPSDGSRESRTADAQRSVEPKPTPPSVPSQVDDAKAHAERSAPAGLRWKPHVSLLADGAVGVLPGAHLGGALWIGTDVGRLAISLVGAFYPATPTTPDNARAPIDFALLEGRANLTYWFLGPALRIGPSVSLHGGVIESDQAGSSASAVREPWLSVGLGPQVLVRVGGPVSFFAEGELNVPLLMPTFVLDDGSEVHRPGVGARLALGGRISLRE